MIKKKIVLSRYKNSILYMLRDEKQPIEYQLFSDTQDTIGNIYVCEIKDKVKNIDASFVNYGNGKKGFFNSLNYKNGEMVPLQLIKAGTELKAPTFSDKLTLSGMYVVVTNSNKKFSISKKLTNEERSTLNNLYGSFFADLEYGITLRTNSLNASMKDVLMEADELANKLDEILNHGNKRTCGTVLYKQTHEWIKYCLSVNAFELDEIITDDIEIYNVLNNEIINKFTDINPEVELKLYKDELLSLNRLYSVETGLEAAVNKKVWLKSGGFIIIEQTEALVSIDVNTGKTSKINIDPEDNYYNCNIEACDEIARQLRLRNLSGIIVIDFINMKKEENKSRVIEYLKKTIKNDRQKVSFHDMTALSLVELTRKKEREPLSEQIKGLR